MAVPVDAGGRRQAVPAAARRHGGPARRPATGLRRATGWTPTSPGAVERRSGQHAGADRVARRGRPAARARPGERPTHLGYDLRALLEPPLVVTAEDDGWRCGPAWADRADGAVELAGAPARARRPDLGRGPRRLGRGRSGSDGRPGDQDSCTALTSSADGDQEAQRAALGGACGSRSPGSACRQPVPRSAPGTVARSIRRRREADISGRAWQSYANLVGGLTRDGPRPGGHHHPGAAGPGRAGGRRGRRRGERMAKLAEEIGNASRANRELLENLIVAEVDRAASRLGFARAEDLQALRGRGGRAARPEVRGGAAKAAHAASPAGARPQGRHEEGRRVGRGRPDDRAGRASVGAPPADRRRRDRRAPSAGARPTCRRPRCSEHHDRLAAVHEVLHPALDRTDEPVPA